MSLFLKKYLEKTFFFKTSLHPSLPLLLTSSGQRWFKMNDMFGDDDEELEMVIPKTMEPKRKLTPENSIKLWQFEAQISSPLE